MTFLEGLVPQSKAINGLSETGNRRPKDKFLLKVDWGDLLPEHLLHPSPPHPQPTLFSMSLVTIVPFKNYFYVFSPLPPLSSQPPRCLKKQPGREGGRGQHSHPGVCPPTSVASLPLPPSHPACSHTLAFRTLFWHTPLSLCVWQQVAEWEQGGGTGG